MSERTVAVIGSGPAGLAAAWRLNAAGRGVRLYEARSELGGRLRTERLGAASADSVVQLFAGDYAATRRLVEELGLGARLVGVPGRDAIWRGGRPHLLRYGSITSMATSGGLPTRLKIRLGLRYVPFLERHASVLDLNAPGRAAELDGESIASWGLRELGEEFVELLAYPLLAAYYGVTPEETSAAFFHALAREGMGVEVVGVRGGVGPLAAEMGAALEERGVAIRAGRRVEALERSAGRVTVRTAEGVASHAAVVVAVPAPEAARLLPEAALPRAVRTRSSATLVLATEGHTRTGWFGLSIPRTEPGGDTLSAVCVQEEKETGLGGVDRGALVVFPAPRLAERWHEAEPRAVLEEARPALERVVPEILERVVEARVVRVPALVVPEPGHFRRLEAHIDDLPPEVALAGDYRVAPTVEGAVRSGLAAAERLTAGPA
jgi:oxygen-dependent protoporphyrinogen oxidase